ncbi:hypothetical protein H4R18_005631 [Coemansia javaensis]|uniref:Uncharacterized protein n=1 Tax=Coemansia javaensis TaxID=2761396 RepID=A0A9W8LE00_9FUNG|nr:hypothetical protein H4R18_005631 [Coemansia javaensis]
MLFIQGPMQAALPPRRVGPPAAFQSRAEDADDIDDILGSLWPTVRAEPPLPPPLVLRQAAAAAAAAAAATLHGQRTPPEERRPGGVYALTAPAQQAAPPGCAAPVSASIQIGDPEWRIGSREGAGLPSPVSPATPQASVAGPDGPLRPALGLPGAAARALPTLRRATLGPLRPPTAAAKPAARALTPEERVARLHSVSGLAARAVARRCLSGQIADPAAALRPLHAAPLKKKPTFADIARGPQAPMP